MPNNKSVHLSFTVSFVVSNRLDNVATTVTSNSGMAPNIIDGMLEISLSLNPPPIKNGRKPAPIPEITKSAAGTLSARAKALSVK